MEAMDFFRMTAGRWISQRTTHHLAMRRTELGQLEITASVLDASDTKVAEICQMHEVDPAQAIGGAAVSWQGSMQWDEEGQTQTGATILVLVPDGDDPNVGQLLREQGYAETAPIVGRYWVDEQDGLVLTTDYSTMSSVERFSFINAATRIRTSTVIGLSNTASFCFETRIDGEHGALIQEADRSPEAIKIPAAHYSALGW
ncbi:MAG: phycobiliprotein lyase [Cyanobacteria bacterium P01_C01_bin.147]